MTREFDFDRFQDTLAGLGGPRVGSIVVHGSIDSTSSDLKRRLDNGAGPGTVVVAKQQTAGRGRSGRTWLSGQTGNLYLSFAIPLGEIGRDAVPMVPLAAGIAACDAISAACGVTPALKWPNDLLVAGKKLAGILTELVTVRRDRPLVIVGIGVNTGTEAFPEALSEIATSVPLLTGEAGDPSVVAAGFVHGLRSWTARIEAGETAAVVAAWLERAEPFGRRVRVGAIEGTTRQLTTEGRLVVVQDNGEAVEVVGGIVENLE